MNLEAAAVVQEAGELQCLTLGPALLEAVNQLKNNWFQFKRSALRNEKIPVLFYHPITLPLLNIERPVS